MQWFTDTASTAVNKIQAGTLDIALEMKEGNEWVDAEGKTLEFKKAASAPAGEEVLWEPGATYALPELRIVNKGNLALKYKIAIAGAKDATPENDKNDLMLLDVIDWTYEVDGTSYALESEKHLAAKKGDEESYNTFTVKGHMQETANNDYQGLSIDSIAITVVATQDTVEHDSYTNEYDKNATYPVTNNAGLSDALNEAGEGSTVVIASGEYALPSTGIPAGVAISGEGMGKTNLTVPATKSGNRTTGLIVNKPGVSVSNATITGHGDITSDMYSGLLDIREGGTILDNVEIVNRTSQASGVVINSGVSKGKTVTMKNSKLNVYYRAFFVADGANGTIEIDNCDITGSIYALNVNSGNSQNLVIKCTNSKLHGWSSYGEIKSASFENVEFSKGASNYDYLRPYADTTLKNCTFDNAFKMGAGKAGFTITIEDCTYNGTVLTATNVRDLLFDSDDLSNLKGCTITVNGVSVVL